MLSHIFVTAISSMPPGGRYVARQVGFSGVPWWAWIISGGAALWILVLMLRRRIQGQ